MNHSLILIDIQNEYIIKGRPYYLNGIENSLDSCRRILSFARNKEWDIVHVQHSNENRLGADRFLPGTTTYDFVEGFTPKDNEKHFVKTDFSCYSSPAFSDYMEEAHNLNANITIYVIGYNSVMCCLSTLEEARRRNHRLHFVTDASLAKSIAGMNERQSHAFMMALYKEKNLGALITAEKLMEA